MEKMVVIAGVDKSRVPGRRGTTFYAVATNIYGSSVLILLHVTLLARGILRWLLILLIVRP